MPTIVIIWNSYDWSSSIHEEEIIAAEENVKTWPHMRPQNHHDPFPNAYIVTSDSSVLQVWPLNYFFAQQILSIQRAAPLVSAECRQGFRFEQLVPFVLAA